MVPQIVASLSAQIHEFQAKVSANITRIDTQLSELSADQKEESIQVHNDFATTTVAIHKLQDSVQILINHFRLGTTEPSSTSAVLSSSSTPLPKGGLLPNPLVDHKLKVVQPGMPNHSTGLLIGMPTAQLEPLFSFDSMLQPNYTQHTMGSHLVDDTVPIPNSPPRPHDKNFVHLHLDFDIDRQPYVFPKQKHYGNDLRTHWIEGLSHPHTHLCSLADPVAHGSGQRFLFDVLNKHNVPCLRNGWFQGGKYDADLEELNDTTCLFTLGILLLLLFTRRSRVLFAGGE